MSRRVRHESELPAWLWLWLPLLPVVLLVATYFVAPQQHKSWFGVKEGPLEWATAIVLVPAVICGLYALRLGRALPGRWLKVWIGMVTLGAFYFGGEEVSWGQWIWHWDAPQFFEEHNKQAETNIHNMSSWFNEKPRQLLQLWILVGGVFLALRQRRAEPAERWKKDGWRYWFWPTWVAFPAALLSVLIYLPKRLEKWVFGSYEPGTFLADVHLSEPMEFYIAYFLMLYLLSLAVRTRLAASLAEGREPEQAVPSPAVNPAESSYPDL